MRKGILAPVFAVQSHYLPCRHSQVSLPEPVGCIGLTEDPNVVLAALRRSVVLYDLTKQSVIR